MNRSLATFAAEAIEHDHDDAPSREGLSVVDGTGIHKGNADIECERSPPKPDNAFTLPIYPTPSDLPQR